MASGDVRRCTNGRPIAGAPTRTWHQWACPLRPLHRPARGRRWPRPGWRRSSATFRGVAYVHLAATRPTWELRCVAAHAQSARALTDGERGRYFDALLALARISPYRRTPVPWRLLIRLSHNRTSHRSLMSRRPLTVTVDTESLVQVMHFCGRASLAASPRQHHLIRQRCESRRPLPG